MTSPVTVHEVEAQEREAWDSFCREAQGTELGHRWDFQELLIRLFRVRVVRLAARRGSAWVGVLPLVLQKSMLGTFLTSVPYLNYAGVLGADAAGRRALGHEALELARRFGADRLELRGRNGEDLPIETWRAKSSFVSELPEEVDVLWKALGSKVRAQVKRPRKEGYTARLVGAEGLRAFYPLLARRWHELGSPVLPERFFRDLEALPGLQMEYVLVEKGEQSVAAGVLVRSGNRVEIPWAASAAEHNRFGVNMLLYWTALESAITNGAGLFDYGRSTPGTGTARFKLQWGAREEPLYWNVFAGSKKGKASERGARGRSLAAALWKRMPAFFVHQLGPRLAARIPL